MAELFFGPPATAPPIVRRYREQPSPLVRDAVRGWQTGRIDRIYAADFDMDAHRNPKAAGSPREQLLERNIALMKQWAAEGK